MTITLVADAEGDLAAFVAEIAPGRADLVAVRTTPGGEDAGDVCRRYLVALGKDPMLLDPRSVANARVVQWASAWTAARPVASKTVVYSEALATDAWRWLHHVAGLRSVTVVLAGRSRRLSLPEGIDVATASVDYAREVLTEATATTGDAPQPRETERFPPVPDDEFPFFLGRCSETLEDAQMAQVQAAFDGGYEAARAFRLPAEKGREQLEQDVGDLLREITSRLVSRHEILTTLRGAQSGFFARGLLVRVSGPAVAAAGRSAPPPRLDSAHLTTLYASPDPAQVLAAGLSILGATTMDLLRLRDVLTPATLSLAGIPRDVAGLRDAFVALAVENQLRTDRGDQHLFVDRRGNPMTEGQLRSLLRKANRELGLNFSVTQLSADPRSAARLWRNRRHIRVDRLRP